MKETICDPLVITLHLTKLNAQIYILQIGY